MKILRLFGFLLRSARTTVLLMMAAGILAGLFSAAFLALISRALVESDSPAGWLLLGFVAVAIGKIVTVAAAQVLVVRFSQGAVLDLSLTLCRKVVATPLYTLERQRGGAVLAVLTDDVTSITWAVQCLPQLATHMAVLLGCAAYLAWLSWQIFVALAVVTLISAIVYHFLYRFAFQHIEAARLAKSQLIEHFRALLAGMRELMMHRSRRDDFIERELHGAAEQYRRENLRGAERYALAEAWVQIVYYALVGIVLFAFPWAEKPAPETLTAYVFAMLYLMNPIYAIVGTVPAIARGQVALERVEELGVRLGAHAVAASETRARPTRDDAPLIEMRGAEFHYETPANADAPFVLGPIDFEIRPGEVVFVVGGNGSGKSTFVKLLAGLYAPQRGALRFAGIPIDDPDREWYREQIAVVFSEPYVFDKLLGLARDGLDADAQRLLQRLQLDHKVAVRDGVFSTTKLSQGQRKRLALVVAYLEDRPVYVFDEWAADQDPDYKRVFYTQLLPELRARGKAVVVITHDDRYFELGDRLVTLEDGRVRAQ